MESLTGEFLLQVEINTLPVVVRRRFPKQVLPDPARSGQRYTLEGAFKALQEISSCYFPLQVAMSLGLRRHVRVAYIYSRLTGQVVVSKYAVTWTEKWQNRPAGIYMSWQCVEMARKLMPEAFEARGKNKCKTWDDGNSILMLDLSLRRLRRQLPGTRIFTKTQLQKMRDRKIMNNAARGKLLFQVVNPFRKLRLNKHRRR